jgi:hypothetical protein
MMKNATEINKSGFDTFDEFRPFAFVFLGIWLGTVGILV